MTLQIGIHTMDTGAIVNVMFANKVSPGQSQ